MIIYYRTAKQTLPTNQRLAENRCIFNVTALDVTFRDAMDLEEPILAAPCCSDLGLNEHPFGYDNDPFGPRSQIPLPYFISCENGAVRKRNERERHRVRCVNEGYARLRYVKKNFTI